MLKKIFVPLIALAMALPFFSKAHIVQAQAVTVENAGDGFYLSETSYNASESFVYTAVANFESGQAAAMVIGGAEDSRYWVFNVDRYDNRTKLLYFGRTGADMEVSVLKEEPFIGNDKTTASEYNVINPKLRNCPQFNFKVVVTIDDGHAYAEFFIDNIKRFGVDETIDLNTIKSGVTYGGGHLGFNVFNAKVNFDDIHTGKSDYAYYTELYRNQYHYSQYAHWNNDPNGLVYYDGWYHMYYQTHPYSQYWDHMYWGHARSRDLIHWQELPYALFPDDGTMGMGLEVGYAWSGIAMVYHPGMSQAIDELNWFPNGSGTGLLGYYTRDGAKQDQIIITSDDGGMTWVKRRLISQHIIYDAKKIDCRDPSIFAVKKDNEGKVTLWGMVLSGATTDKYWFLKSENLLDWSFAGEQYLVYPECMTVSKVKADDNEEHSIITVASRYYTVGDFTYDEVTGHINFILTDGRNIKDVKQSEAFKMMDYGEDSYAAQVFNIDDENSEYYGKAININWFSGLPSDAESGIYAEVRKPWNGGGMTIPAELGLAKVGEEYLLTQKPITINNTHLEKTELVNVSALAYNNENDPLNTVNSHLIELEANISNENEESVEFKVNVSSDEYTSFGWTKKEGYFFDRTHTSKAGINFTKNYSHRFTTGPVDGKNLSFYVLVDNGSLELFCDNYKYAFYNLTLAAPYSIGASLTTSGEVNINTLKVKQISSIWHDIADLDKGILYVDKQEVELDLTIGQSKEVMAYSTKEDEITWSIISGEDIVSLEKTIKGATITALKNGVANIKAKTVDSEKVIVVTVDDAEVKCDYELKAGNVYSGDWLTTTSGLVAKQNQGDGFLVSDMVGSDFTYTATVNLENANAAGLLLRASKDMSSYIMTNYDKNARVCKIWSPNGFIASGAVNGDINNSNIALTVKTADRFIDVYLNGNLVVSGKAKEADPLTGYYGLNVFNGKAVFNNISVLKSEYSYANEDLVVGGGTAQYIKGVYNVTDKNTLIDPSYYHTEGDSVVIHNEYFQLLEENKTYAFYIEGELVSFTVKVEVGSIDRELVLNDISIKLGEVVNVYVGAFKVESVLVNDEVVTYELRGNVVHLDASLFEVGENTVSINGVTFKVTVVDIMVVIPEPEPEPTPVPDPDPEPVEPDPEPQVDPEPTEPEQPTEPETSPETPTEEKKGGCGGSIIAGSTLITITSLIGFALMSYKKRKDN